MGGCEVADGVAAELLVRRDASSQATADSATTASASTAATSERSTSAVAGSPVARSTERSGFIRVGSGFIAARITSSSPFDTPASSPPARLVSRGWSTSISSCASEPNLSRERESLADLDALHRLDAHQRGREARVEPVVLRCVAAEPGGQVPRPHLDDAADGVARGARLVDACAQLLLVERRAHDLDADRREQRLRDPPAATCTAVWRAEARSSAFRTSSRSYLVRPRGPHGRAAAG